MAAQMALLLLQIRTHSCVVVVVVIVLYSLRNRSVSAAAIGGKDESGLVDFPRRPSVLERSTKLLGVLAIVGLANYAKDTQYIGLSGPQVVKVKNCKFSCFASLFTNSHFDILVK